MTLSEGYKAPENKFDYFLQNQLCKHKYVFPKFSIFQRKFKPVTVEEKLCHLSERGCTSHVKS
jgi:hypothetical protein